MKAGVTYKFEASRSNYYTLELANGYFIKFVDGSYDYIVDGIIGTMYGQPLLEESQVMKDSNGKVTKIIDYSETENVTFEVSEDVTITVTVSNTPAA